jgi:hypothetical protein
LTEPALEGLKVPPQDDYTSDLETADVLPTQEKNNFSDVNSPEQSIRRLFGKIPTTITEAVAMGAGIQVSNKPWSTTRDGDKLTVYLPPNLESKADDPLTIAAIAACKVLQPQYLWSSELAPETVTLDKKPKQYLTGIAWALQEGGQKLVPYQDVSGPTGYGYYWVAHRSLEQTVGSVWWAKGISKHPTEGLTGKAWSKDLDETTRRIESLLSLAARKKDATSSCLTYFRSRESFLGREISKQLPYNEGSIITAYEKEFLQLKYDSSIKAYHALIESLPCTNINDIVTLASRIKLVMTNLKPLRDRCEAIVSHRMNILYSKKMGKRKKTGDTIENRIDRLELIDRIHAFDPLIVLPEYRVFRINDDLNLDDTGVRVNVCTDYMNVVNSQVRSNHIPREYGESCTTWLAALLQTERWELPN